MFCNLHISAKYVNLYAKRRRRIWTLAFLYVFLHAPNSKVRKFTRKTEASTIRKTGNQNGGKSVENSWECWTIRKTGSQNTSRFDTSMLKAACFTIVIFWKVRHYESKSLIFHAMFTGWSHYFYDLFFVIFHTCLVLEYSVLQFAHFSKVRKFTRKTEASYLDLGIFVRVFTRTEQQST